MTGAVLQSIGQNKTLPVRDSIASRTVPDTAKISRSAIAIRPMAKGVMNDSTGISKSKPDSNSNRFVEAYYNVKIFSDSLQAVGDSLFYSFEDSAFRLFKNPIVWAQENQITGDTIYLFTSNKKPKRMYVFENALAVNKVDKFYNQVKGNTLNSYFVDGNIEHD